MIECVQFQHFKVLRSTTLPLGRFTLIVGPNGSGKSTALQALRSAGNTGRVNFDQVASTGLDKGDAVSLLLKWAAPNQDLTTKVRWHVNGCDQPSYASSGGTKPTPSDIRELNAKLSGIRVYSLNANLLAAPVQLQPNMQLSEDGGHLAGVLDQLRDRDPERFEALNGELGRWLPEFDRISFTTPGTGSRAFLLRTRKGHHPIRAADLSQGTLLALAILTLAYLPDPPAIVGLEEPDRGIHPRLLRDVRDALYRLSYPESFNERREPTQVVTTTHSPYFLDLFKDHPEEIVIAHKLKGDAVFQRLSELPDLQEVLEDGHLGDVWYSGILGGVPSEQ